MMNIQVQVVQLGSLSGFVIGVLFDPTAPTIALQSQSVALPLSGSGIMSFTNLNNQNYIFREYISSDQDYLHGSQVASDIQVDAGESNTGTTQADIWITGANFVGNYTIAGPYASDIMNLSLASPLNTLYYNIIAGAPYWTLNIYSDSAKTQLVAVGTVNIIGGTGTGVFVMNIQQQNNSGVSGTCNFNIATGGSTSSANIISYPTTNKTIYNGIVTGFIYWVEQIGIGTLEPGVVIQYLSNGGFQFINGYVVQPSDTFVLHFQPNISTNGSSGNVNASGNLFSGNNIITTSQNLAASQMGSIIIIQSSSASNIQLTLPEPTTFPDNIITKFVSEGGSHILAYIIPTTQIKYCGQIISGSAPYKAFYLAQGESVDLFKIGTTFYVASDSSAFKTVGTIFDSLQISEMNSLLCDGGIYNRADYKRLWDYILRLTGNDAAVSDVQWLSKNANTMVYPYLGNFSTGNGSTTFRMPLLMETWDAASNGSIVSSGFVRGGGIPNVGITLTSGYIGAPTPRRYAGQGIWDKVGPFMSTLSGFTYNCAGGTNGFLALGLWPAGTPGLYNPQAGTYQKQALNPTQFLPLPNNQNNPVLNTETAPANNIVYKSIRY